MTDEELKRFIGLFGASVYKTALCCVKDRYDADDIMQDVFLKLYTYNGSFDSDEHVKSWLLKCTVNAGRDILRSYWRKNSVPLDSLADSPAPENKDGDSILPLILKLGRKNRTVLYMFYYEGYATEEIASVLGISRTAVTSRLNRGRKQLAELLQKERSEHDE